MFEGFQEMNVDGRGARIHLRMGGTGPPLLLLHGYPQTHVIWHRVAPRLAEAFTVIAPDLRGYGDSSAPPGGPRHGAYAKRAMALDMVAVMDTLGYPRFDVAGHDRGGRVAHRLGLDHPGRVRRLAVLDIVPTRFLFEHLDQAVAQGYYHWFFLSQADGLPEHLIGLDPGYFLEQCLQRWSRCPGAFTAEALAEYRRCFDAATIHASCEDYRAAAGIDLEHDREDGHCRLDCPLQVLWGRGGIMGRFYDVLGSWQDCGDRISGQALPGGHFLPEEAPEETLAAFTDFFRP